MDPITPPPMAIGLSRQKQGHDMKPSAYIHKLNDMIALNSEFTIVGWEAHLNKLEASLAGAALDQLDALYAIVHDTSERPALARLANAHPLVAANARRELFRWVGNLLPYPTDIGADDDGRLRRTAQIHALDVIYQLIDHGADPHKLEYHPLYGATTVEPYRYTAVSWNPHVGKKECIDIYIGSKQPSSVYGVLEAYADSLKQDRDWVMIDLVRDHNPNPKYTNTPAWRNINAPR